MQRICASLLDSATIWERPACQGDGNISTWCTFASTCCCYQTKTFRTITQHPGSFGDCSTDSGRLRQVLNRQFHREAHVHCNPFLPMLVAFPAENTKKGLKAATPLMDLCPLPSRFYIVKCGVARPMVWHSCIPGTSVTQSWVFECVTLGCLANVKGSTQAENRFPFEYNIPVINLPRAEFPAFP